MKKILITILYLITIFTLTSCGVSDWEEFPISSVSVLEYDTYSDGSKAVITIRIRLPNELIEKMNSELLEINVKVFLDIMYYNDNTDDYETIEDYLFIISFTDEFSIKKKILFDFSKYLEDADCSILDVKVTKAFYCTEKMHVENPNGNPNVDKYIVGLCSSLLIALISYLTIVIYLGIKVNERLTKKYKGESIYKEEG